MNKQEQKSFINALCQNVENEIWLRADKGEFPETWDGKELRQYIAEKYASCVIKGTLSGKRLKDYKNYVLVNNL